jgi:hypothetical protein
MDDSLKTLTLRPVPIWARADDAVWATASLHVAQPAMHGLAFLIVTND